MRLGGYNTDSQELFIQVPARPEYLTTNTDFVSRYFPSFQPSLGVSHFLKEKTGDTFRIFVMGGSSTQGFPYNFYGSFSSQLEERLLMETQGLNIEVINLGMTAVNSYVIWDLSRKLMDYEPDAIMIYAGHNEYYGSFGVGSTQFAMGKSVGVKRLILRLKHWRLYQFLESLVEPDQKISPENRTMMAKVVRDAEISIGDEVFEAGIKQFQDNISEVLSLFQKESVPVFIGTVASNLKDQSPLGDNEEAINIYQEGEELYNKGKVSQAAEAYLQAKELDGLRFRAPERINEVILKQATAYGAHTVYVNEVVARESESTIPDSSFFVDHLHPDWEGHQVIADLFFEELLNQVTTIKSAYRPNELYRSDALTKFEATYSKIPIERLTSGYPFKKGLSEEEEYSNFEASYNAYLRSSYTDSIAVSAWRMQRQVSLALTDVVNYASLNGDSLSVINHYKQLAYWQIYNDMLLKKGAQYALNNRKFDSQSAKLLHLILRVKRQDPFFANSLAALYLIHQDLERAEGWLESAKVLDENSLLLWYNYARLFALKGDSLEARYAYEKYLSLRDAR